MPDSYKKRTMHTWPQKEASYVAPEPQQTSHHTTKLFDVVQQLGEVRMSIGHLTEAHKETRTDIKTVSDRIVDSLDHVSSQLTSYDARLDAIEIHLARQDAEAAGFKRALRVGGAILSGASVAFGWLLSQAGGAILMSLGLGGK